MSKRTRRKPSVARTWANEGRITPEYARKIGDDAEEREIAYGSAGKATVLYVRTSPIAYLAGRKKLTPSMVEAAERLREDFDQSGLDTLKAQDLTRERVDGGGHKGAPELLAEPELPW